MKESFNTIESSKSKLENSKAKLLLSNFVLTAAYLLLGIAGIELAIPPGYATVIFLSAGIGFVAILYAGNRLLPGVWLGSFCLNLWIAWINNDLGLNSVLVASIIGMSSSLQAWVAAYLVAYKYKVDWQRLVYELDIIKFLFLAGPLACLVSASWGSATLFLFNVIPSEKILLNWWNWWVGDTAGVIICAPLTLIFLQKQERLWRNRIINVAIPTVATLIAVTLVFIYASYHENLHAKSQLMETGKSIENKIQSNINAYKEIVSSIGNLIKTSPNLQYDEFDKFTQSIFARHSDLHALSWNPRINDSDRKIFEMDLEQQLKILDIQITQRDKNGYLIPSEKHEWYVPVAYITPLIKNVKAIAFNIASNPLRLDAINKALNTGKHTVTAPIRLVQETGSSVGILLLVPISQDHSASDIQSKDIQSNPNTFDGFAVGVFRIEEMLQDLFDLKLPKGLSIVLEDKNAHHSNNLLYSSSKEMLPITSEYFWITELAFSSRIWQISVHATINYITDKQYILARQVFVAGLILTSLLQVLLLIITGRNSIILEQLEHHQNDLEQMVSEQTAEIKQAQLYTRSLIETSLDPLVTISPQGLITDVNKATENATGLSRDYLIGTNFSLYFTNSKHAELGYQEAFNTGYVRDYLLQIKNINGTIIPVSLNASLYTNLSGDIIGIFAVARDISKQIEAEKKQDLALKEAEQANQSKSEFLANMSHELRTPMHGILSFARFGLQNIETANKEKLSKYFGRINTSGERLLVLLNDLLDLSKLEAGQMILDFENNDLLSILNKCLAEQETRIEEKSLQIKRSLIHHCVAEFDKLLISQVITNLLSNAIKFTPHGKAISISIDITTLNNDPALSFCIEDEGIGIPEGEEEQVFDKFIQSSRTKNNVGGTGLGLSISQKIIIAHYGEIWAENGVTGGAIFKFVIPVEVNKFS